MRNPLRITKTTAFAGPALNCSPWRRAVLALLVTNLAISVLPTVAQTACPQNCSGAANTAVGVDALFNVTTGIQNTALGSETMYANTTGSNNTAVGNHALQSNPAGNDNTSFGAFALSGNYAGNSNTAIGRSALYANGGENNTATGAYALVSNAGNYNTADGASALYNNTTGLDNTASGTQALFSNTTGSLNTADGLNTLYSNTIGSSNTASGYLALSSNSTGSFNTAVGDNALLNNTTGGANIALGDSAGSNLTTGKNNIDIGNKGVAGEANTMRIGKKGTQTATYIAGISGTTVAGGVGVLIDTNGRLGTVVSSERFKKAIQPMDKASEAIFSLKPVTFRYKHELDPDGIPQFGLVAEQVEKVNPELVARDDQGKPYTVRYEAVNAMLLNEFLKEHQKVEEQDSKQQKLETIVAQQQREIKDLTSALKAQAAQIQKVTRVRRVENNRPAPRIVTNDQ